MSDLGLDADESEEWMRVLVAYDGTEEARRAVKMGHRFADDWLGLASVVPTTGTGIRGGAIDPMDDIPTHQAMLAEAGTGLAEQGIKAELVTVVGDPGQAICAVAHEHQADLVVIGSRDRRGLKKLLLGSVSLYVVSHAHCDVLVVR